jgi:hypothetical protein
MSNVDLILRLFLQLAVILAACRLVGMVGRRLGQAQVVCEMITGVLLGPSLFGLLLPHLQSALFPQNIIIGGVTITHPSMSILYVIAHLGLALYLFLVGSGLPALRCARGRVSRLAHLSSASPSGCPPSKSRPPCRCQRPSSVSNRERPCSHQSTRTKQP